MGLVVAFALGLAFVGPAAASEQQVLVDLAREKFAALVSEPDFEPYRAVLSQAKAVLIVPELAKVGFLIGSGGGTGVFLTRKGELDEWSPPAFYQLGLGTIGFLIFPELWDIVLFVMTDRALDGFVSGKLSLGNDIRFTTDPHGGGATGIGDFTDIVAYATSRNAVAGLPLQGASVWSVESWNEAYYDQEVPLREILFGGNLAMDGADRLREALAAAD